MFDCKGTELHVGDHVVYIRGANASAMLETGHITKIWVAYDIGRENNAFLEKGHCPCRGRSGIL